MADTISYAAKDTDSGFSSTTIIVMIVVFFFFILLIVLLVVLQPWTRLRC